MALPEPHFIDRDPLVVLAECIARYESLTGKKLQPAQSERLLLDVIAYRETLLRIGIQEAAKQNLWRFARYPMIDFLAEVLGPTAARLVAKPARTMLRWELEEPELDDVVVPMNSRSRTTDDRVTFATDKEVTIPAGDTYVDVSATATVVGAQGNGYIPGQVNKIVDPLSVAATVTNLTTTADGSAEEDTERMRERLPDALGAQAAAGPEDAYRAHARAAHPDVLDASVSTPDPGIVRVAVLATYGFPTELLLEDVEAVLSDEKVRPICDTVLVVAADPVEYEIDVQLTLYLGVDEDEAIAAASAAATAYTNERRSGLGRAPVASQINAKLKVPGVYKVTVVSPVDPPVAPDEWASCTSVTITVVGYTTEKEPAE